MDVTFMGTASAAGSAKRDNTYMLLSHEECSWLIDVGGNPLGKLKMASVPVDRIRGVILTHFHVDHLYGLPSLLWGMWIAGRTKPLPIYCPGTGAAQLQAILDSFQVQQWPIRFELSIRPFEWTVPTVLFEENELTVSTFPVQHAGPTVGIQAVHGDRVLVYSADTRPSERIRNLPGIDLLVHEATRARGNPNNHTSLEELLHFYPIRTIGRVCAVHLTDGEPYADVLAEAGEAVSSRILLPDDMVTVTV